MLRRGIAVSVTGCGEDLIRTSMARETATAIWNYDNTTQAISNSVKAFLGKDFFYIEDDDILILN